jgi:hypothetical protein
MRIMTLSPSGVRPESTLRGRPFSPSPILSIRAIIINLCAVSTEIMSSSDILAVPGQLVNQLRRSVSAQSRVGRSVSPGQLLNSVRRSASTQSRYGRSVSPGDLVNEPSSSIGSQHGRYEYMSLPDSLKKIRLVILQPALSDDEEVRCELETIDISKAKYEALSYAWGDTTDKTPIFLGGGRFLVTKNLEHALRSLRALSSDSKQRRVLWIDALCIDQENNVERTQQVKRMGSIYKSAERVLVWLGNYYEKEDDLVRFEIGVWGFRYQNPGTLQTTEDAFKLAEALFEESSVAASRKNKSKKSRLTPTMNLHIWGYLSIICQRPWFRRLWVIQEIMMARKVIMCCGRVQLKWRILEGAADRIAAYFESPNEWPFFAKLRFIDEMTSFAGNISIVGLWDLDRKNVLSILVHTQYSEATDARDRLFALKSLLSSEDTDIYVDYSEPAETVYTKWALRRIRRTRSLDVLTLCTDSIDSKKEQMPSWVPDLRKVALVDDTFFSLANGFSQNHERSYAAAGMTKCQEVMIDEKELAGLAEGKFNGESILSLQGFHVGTIDKRISLENKFGINYSTDQLPRAVTFLGEQISWYFKTSLYCRPQLYDAFLESLFKGWKWYAGSHPSPTLATRCKVWRGHASVPADFEPYMIATVRLRDYLGSLEMITRLMLRVSDLFITSNGSIGSMSKHCQADIGDKIYVLFGGNAPFILKKYKFSDGKVVYKLRCACFLHGYMQGEAIESWKNGELKLETLNIA